MQAHEHRSTGKTSRLIVCCWNVQKRKQHWFCAAFRQCIIRLSEILHRAPARGPAREPAFYILPHNEHAHSFQRRACMLNAGHL